MRVARLGYLCTTLSLLAFLAPGAARAATTATPSFKVTISPQYTTAGQPTTFHVTIANLSSPGTTLGSIKLVAPKGFTSPQPKPGSPLRTKTRVQGRTLSVQRVALKPGATTQLSIVATAPSTCGRTVLRWSGQGFENPSGSGSELALQAGLSSLGVTVLCPATAACGDGGPPCSTSLVTSQSTYAVVSDAPSGTLRQTVNVGNELTCGTYRFRDANWYDSLIVPPTSSPPTAAPVAIVDNITYKIKNAKQKGIGFCLGAGYQFTTASGGQAAPGTLPNGNPGFIGLLPRCSNAAPPCIGSVRQQRDTSTKVGYDAIMKIQIPENGDPWGHS